jgi:hypothetical protein
MSGLNIGYSSRLPYDHDAYAAQLDESTQPLMYKLDPTQIDNCRSCLSVFGPRPMAGPHSFGVSTPQGPTTAPSQRLVDVESILQNRNMIASRARGAEVNDIDVSRFHLRNPRICNEFLDPIASHLTNPPANYRGMAINRFYDIHANPQMNLFWDQQINTQLEAKDNYREPIPYVRDYDPVLPRELKGKQKPCKVQCSNECNFAYDYSQ